MWERWNVAVGRGWGQSLMVSKRAKRRTVSRSAGIVNVRSNESRRTREKCRSDKNVVCGERVMGVEVGGW